MDRLYCLIDYETRSEVDLRRIGAHDYAIHPSTSVLCVAWRLGNRAALSKARVQKSVFNKRSDILQCPLNLILSNPNITMVAHQAFFEQMITRYVLGINVPIERWICTASLAAAMALPRSLEEAALALSLPVQKDMEGRRLILKWCKPRKSTKKNQKQWCDDPAELAKIISYCQKDVEVTTELFLRLPPLTPHERQVWELDQKINHRGFRVDRDLVTTTLSMIKEETIRLDEYTWAATNGGVTSTRQRDKLLHWVKAHGVEIPDVRAKTISDVLRDGVKNEKAKTVLQLRQEASKSSTAKYKAFEERSRADGRVRDHLLYHGCSTGRWSGRGAQTQNLPRPNIRNTDFASSVLKEGDVKMVRLLYGSPMDAFSSCIRSVIIPAEGKEFFCGDYASIEARVLFWLANHQEGLNAYREDRDLYKEMAAVIYDKPVEDIGKWERDVGKRAILGCGYSMGHRKFHITCKVYGQEIAEEVAYRAVQAYRSEHHPVAAFWRDTERMAIRAVKTPGEKFTANHVSWFMDKDFLFCQLPSCRRLAYYKPEIRYENTLYEEKAPRLYHWSVDSTSKKWVCAATYGGKLVENITQAVARDLMACAMLRLEKRGYETVLSVHDEIVAECRFLEGDLENFCNLMAKLPYWAEGLPVKVDGWCGERYRK